MKEITIFVDESGTLPDPNDNVIVIAAVGTTNPKDIDLVIKKARKKGKFKRDTGEFKYYTTGEKSKFIFFKEIVKKKFDIFILIIEKSGRKIPDNPQHYAILCWLILTDVLNCYPQINNITFDRHFHNSKDTKQFNQFLKRYIGILPKISHVDSQKDQKVNIADMIAGAVLSKETNKEKKFYQMFQQQIISETKINWPEAKRKLFEKKLLEPMQASIQAK